MFRGYRFEHPRDEISVECGGWSYLWAGMFGAFYVWHMGFGRLFLRAFAINLLFTVLLLVLFFPTAAIVRPTIAWYGLQAVGIPLLILIQGGIMLRMIRDAYRRRGWLVRLR